MKPEFKDPKILAVEVGSLQGFELVWNYFSKSRKAGAANVQPREGRSLPGLALNVNNSCLAGIDAEEGHPNYYDRGDKPVSVVLIDGRKVDCWLYIARPDRTKNEPIPPSKQYLDLLINAAKKYSFPEWYLNELLATPTSKEHPV
jgi:hypothetical protein